jgi:hypothetical protein
MTLQSDFIHRTSITAAEDAAKPNGHTEWSSVPPPAPTDCTVAAWLARDIPEPDLLLGPFSTTSRTLMVADTGLGKTNLCLAMAFAMALGQPLLHWAAGRRARVLFIDGEMSKRLVKARLRDAVRRAGGVMPETLYVLSRDAVEDLPPLNTPEGQAFVNAFIARLGSVDFLYFDNVQSLLLGDMKDEEPWQQTLPWIRDLTRRSIGQLWVHHTGHNTSQSYGTKTREWQLDMVLLMEDVERATADIAFSLKFTKARERGPDNRADFANQIVTLSNDVWGVDGATIVARSRGPSPIGRKFHDALLNAIAVGGLADTRSAGRPATTRNKWFGECVRLGMLDGSSDDRVSASDRAKLSKYRAELVAANWIACNGDLTWSICQ